MAIVTTDLGVAAYGKGAKWGWSFEILGAHHALVVYDCPNIYTQEGRLFHVNLDDGTSESLDTTYGSTSMSEPCVIHSNGRAYLFTNDDATVSPKGRIYCYDLTTKARVDVEGAAYKRLAGKAAAGVIEGKSGHILMAQSIECFCEWYDPATPAWTTSDAIVNAADHDVHRAYAAAGDLTHMYASFSDSTTGTAMYWVVSLDLTTKAQTAFWYTASPDLTSVQLYQYPGANDVYAVVAPAQGGFTVFKMNGAGAPTGVAALPVGVGTAYRSQFQGWLHTADDYTMDYSAVGPIADGTATIGWTKPDASVHSASENVGTLYGFPIKRLIWHSGEMVGVSNHYGPWLSHTGAVSGGSITGYIGSQNYGQSFQPGSAYVAVSDPFNEKLVVGAYTSLVQALDTTSAWSSTNPAVLDSSAMASCNYWYHGAMGIDRKIYLTGNSYEFAVYDGVAGTIAEVGTNIFTGFVPQSCVPIRGNSRIAISLNKTSAGEIAIFRPLAQDITQRFVPFPGETDQGVLIEAGTDKDTTLGRLICVVQGADSKAICINTYTGATVWGPTTYAGKNAFNGASYIEGALAMGPDGEIWLYTGETEISSIHPTTGAMTSRYASAPSAALSTCRLLWDIPNSILYVYNSNSAGDAKLYKITGLI